MPFCITPAAGVKALQHVHGDKMLAYSRYVYPRPWELLGFCRQAKHAGRSSFQLSGGGKEVNPGIRPS